MVKPAGKADFEYKYLFLDVPRQHRVYLENADAAKSAGKGDGSKGFKMFGFKWA